MEAEYIYCRRYIDFRTEKEGRSAKILKKILRGSFPHSKITLHYGSKIEIKEGNIKSYLIVADDLVFRSANNEDLADAIEDVIGFFVEHRRNNKRDKNRDLELYLNDFKLELASSFHESYPRGFLKRGPWNNLIYQNITTVKQLSKVLIERAKLHKFIYKMVLLFKGNVWILDTCYLNYKEGIGSCLLGKMLLTCP